MNLSFGNDKVGYYKITTQPMNIVLNQKTLIEATKRKPAHFEWPVVGNYATIGGAIKKAMHLTIHDSKVETLEELKELHADVLRMGDDIDRLVRDYGDK